MIVIFSTAAHSHSKTNSRYFQITTESDVNQTVLLLATDFLSEQGQKRSIFITQKNKELFIKPRLSCRADDQQMICNDRAWPGYPDPTKDLYALFFIPKMRNPKHSNSSSVSSLAIRYHLCLLDETRILNFFWKEESHFVLVFNPCCFEWFKSDPLNTIHNAREDEQKRDRLQIKINKIKIVKPFLHRLSETPLSSSRMIKI